MSDQSKSLSSLAINKKIKIALLFGGESGEHEVSVTSALSVYQALDKNQYDVTFIGIDKAGRWVKPVVSNLLNFKDNPRLIKLEQESEVVSLIPFPEFDVILPILHGPHGEDGTVQGLLELCHVPYVGSGVLGSALGMDKELSRKLFHLEGIPVVPTVVLHKQEFLKNKLVLVDRVINQLGLPFFVKPANMGSSVGVHKIKTRDEAISKIENSFLYDVKVLTEKYIPARELECSILGHHEPKASIIGEIIPRHEFYSYEAKYIDENGAFLEVPAKNLNQLTIEKIQDYSKRAFKAIECCGMARVDFFLDRENDQLYLNEINTIPGFTKISMYPKLWDASGIPYSQLLDELIQIAFQKHNEKKSLKSSLM